MHTPCVRNNHVKMEMAAIRDFVEVPPDPVVDIPDHSSVKSAAIMSLHPPAIRPSFLTFCSNVPAPLSRQNLV